ncbi:MAG: hypothetical protein U5J97_10695 [Trueperaceae bacterium]|nr:hypothetical protein [Trueperaceae bacterium]
MTRPSNPPNRTPTEPPVRTPIVYDDDQLPRGRSSWGAIIAGVVAAFAVMLVLEVLMIWLGLSAIDPTRESNPFAGLGTSAAISYLVILAVALFVGGLVTGRLANRVNGSDVFWHGFLTWAVFTLGSLWFAFTAAGVLVSGTLGVVGNAVGAVGGGIAAVAPDLAETQAMVEDQLALSDDVLDEVEPLWTDPDAQQEFTDLITQIFGDGNATIDGADRQDMIELPGRELRAHRDRNRVTRRQLDPALRGGAGEAGRARGRPSHRRRTGGGSPGERGDVGVLQPDRGCADHLARS